MKTMIRKPYVLTCFSFFSMLCIFLGGCATTTPPAPTKTWNLQYKEKVTVSTEPSGARIYVQDNYRGISPIEVTLNGGDLTVKQWGSSLPLHGSIGAGHWTIKAHLDGHEPDNALIQCGKTSAYKRAIIKLRPSSDDRLPSVVVGHNAVLLYLKPLGLSGGGYGSGSYSGSGASPGHSRAYCEQKRREYEAALSEYNRVLKKYNDAKAMGFITDLNWANRQSSQPGFDKGMAFLGMLSGKMTKNDAESAVEVARQRLNAAKEQLCE